MRGVPPTGRRRFLKQTALGALAAGLAPGHVFVQGPSGGPRIRGGTMPERTQGTLPMKWADAGTIQRARELHPFDLQGRMVLASNARTTCVDPNLGYIAFSQIHFQTRPAHMLHTVGDFVDMMGRNTDSLWLSHSATGSHHNDEIVRRITQNAMDVVDQGMAWNPPVWPFVWGPRNTWPKERWAHLPEVTNVILGLVSYHRATGDRRALTTAGSIVRRLYEIAEKNDKYIWYPDFNYQQVGSRMLPLRFVVGASATADAGSFATGAPLPASVKDPRSGTGDGGNQPAAMMGAMLLPAMRYYEDTKDPIAAELATRFSRLIVDLMPDFARTVGQTWSSVLTASGIYKTGLVLGIPEFKQWGENFYRTFTGLDYIPEFGWTPESTGRPRKKDHLCCETCTTVVLLELAAQLAQHSDSKYWDDVERIAMNQLLEGQMLRLDFVEKIPAQARGVLPDLDSQWFTTDHVLERSLGGFGSFSGVNDWIQTGNGQTGLIIVQCCNGSGPRGLYDAWYYAAEERGDEIRVNLQFSKRLPSAVITSYMPGKASIQVELTKPRKLLVRKPGVAAADQCHVFINGNEQKVRLSGSYLDVGGVAAGSVVRVDFPDRTRRDTARIGEVEFQTAWRGNAVVDMAPAGEIYPLYQRRDRQDGVSPLPFVRMSPVNPL